ncbi:hypothetical protein [Mesorhizobium sp. M0496]|uniref:hypothetical protein n=1 Tax=Mesorhizobium sp. M0496 TaxID=2956952 RepID=UPI00333AD67C
MLSRRFDTMPSRPAYSKSDKSTWAPGSASLDTPGVDHAGQDLAPLLQRHVAQIVANQVEQIEGDEIESCCRALRSSPKSDSPASFSTMISPVDDSAFGAKALLASVPKWRYFADQSWPVRV